jgi:hypothetical protein
MHGTKSYKKSYIEPNYGDKFSNKLKNIKSFGIRIKDFKYKKLKSLEKLNIDQKYILQHVEEVVPP